MNALISPAAVFGILWSMASLAAGSAAAEEEPLPPQTPMAPAIASPGKDLLQDAGQRFAECLGASSDCWRGGGPRTPKGELARLVHDYLDAAAARQAKGEDARAQDDLQVLRHWYALTDAIRTKQGALRAGKGADSSPLAAIRSLDPVSGGVAEGCRERSGTLVSGDYLDADLSPDAGPATEVSINLDCAGNDPQACRARVDLVAAGGPDGKGTGLDLVLRDVPVRVHGPIWVFADPRSADTGSGTGPEVLFSVLFDCNAGLGILSWGKLLRYDDWPRGYIE